MGYCMHIRDTRVFIERDKLPHVFANIQALMTQAARQSLGRFSWVNTAAVLAARTLDKQLEEWRWRPEYDKNGNICDLYFEGEKMGDDDKLLSAIAPFVRPNSYIEMQGEDGHIWRWCFDGSQCKEVAATVSFGDSQAGEIIDVEAVSEVHCSRQLPNEGTRPQGVICLPGPR